MGRARKMSPAAKQVVDGAMNREKTLGLPRRFEPAHVSFSLPRRLMGDFRAVVLPAPLAMNYTREDLPACCPIAGELIGHQHMRDILQPFQQLAKEAFGGVFYSVVSAPGYPASLHPDRPHATNSGALH